MAVTYHGKTGLILKHSGDIVQDIYGEASGNCVFQMPAGSWDLIPGKGAVHPMANWMTMERVKTRFTPGFWTLSVDYRGVNLVNEELPPPQYELNRGSAEEPIETKEESPSFVDFAGTPSAPLNGAVFVDGRGEISTDDELGIFDRFKLTSDLKGTSAYLSMTNVSYTETWVTRTMPTDGGKVRIETPPGAPTFTGLSWIYVGMSSTGVRGASCRNRKTWLLGNWKTAIYGSQA